MVFSLYLDRPFFNSYGILEMIYELLRLNNMKVIFFGSESGSEMGSRSGTTPPNSICTATCPCPDESTYELMIGCPHDCRAVDNQGVVCLDANGQPSGSTTCHGTKSRCTQYYSTELLILKVLEICG